MQSVLLNCVCLHFSGNIFKSDVIDKWCIPFLGADRSVMLRSQRFFYESEKKRPSQVQTYIGMPSLMSTLSIIVIGAIFMILCKFSFGRKILLQVSIGDTRNLLGIYILVFSFNFFK